MAVNVGVELYVMLGVTVGVTVAVGVTPERGFVFTGTENATPVVLFSYSSTLEITPLKEV